MGARLIQRQEKTKLIVLLQLWFEQRGMHRAAAVTRGQSVDPADGDPLRQRAHVVDALLQRADRVVDVVVDDLHVEVVSIGALQRITLAHQPLQALVLLKHSVLVLQQSYTILFTQFKAVYNAELTKYCFAFFQSAIFCRKPSDSGVLSPQIPWRF